MKKKIPGYRARRWVVERTHSWLNRFRSLLIRWDKKLENYLALLHLACAWITFRASGLFGQTLSLPSFLILLDEVRSDIKLKAQVYSTSQVTMCIAYYKSYNTFRIGTLVTIVVVSMASPFCFVPVLTQFQILNLQLTNQQEYFDLKYRFIQYPVQMTNIL